MIPAAYQPSTTVGTPSYRDQQLCLEQCSRLQRSLPRSGGSVLNYVKPALRIPFSCEARPQTDHPAVLFYNGIGDHLLVLPTLRALSSIYPHRLRLICDPSARLFLFREIGLQSFLKIDFTRVGHTRLFDAPALARALQPCDL